MSRPVGFGQVGGGKFVSEFPFLSYTSIAVNSGKLACMVSSYAGLVGTASITNVIGWIEAGGTFSCSSSNGDMVPVNTDRSAVCEMPILPSNGTYTETNLKARVHMVCDVNVSEGIQYADTATSSYNTLQIVGYRYYGAGVGEQTVYVKLTEGGGVVGIPTFTGV